MFEPEAHPLAENPAISGFEDEEPPSSPRRHPSVGHNVDDLAME